MRRRKKCRIMNPTRGSTMALGIRRARKDDAEFLGWTMLSASRESLREGRERGCRLAEIITYIGNEAAQSVYQKSGFRFSDERAV
jgi:RimJ/RimL family protein N-acetyltransferase